MNRLPEDPPAKRAKLNTVPETPSKESPHKVTLQLLCTNDTHSQMEPFENNRYAQAIGGVARRAKVFADLRREVPASLTLDAGDLFVGQPFWNVFKGETEMRVLAALGYNASAIGNHDFDGEDENTGEFGIAYFKRIAAQYAPNVIFLCDNVVDEQTGWHPLAKHAVFEPAPGVKVGIVSLFGEQAWEVTSPALRKGLKRLDSFEAAKSSVAELHRQNCDILVCISHTGVDRGDRALAELGLFDVIFSGHAHFYDSNAFEQLHGPGNRLGLVSQGFALGGGVCWARLEFDLTSRCISDHTSGVIVLEDAAQNEAINEMVRCWRSHVNKTLKLDEVLGTCDSELSLPDKEADPWATFSPIHSALQRAIREEFLRVQQPKTFLCTDSAPLVILNRYSAKSGWQPGDVTRADLLQLMTYNNVLVFVELSGGFLNAIINRNAFFFGCADFLYIEGLSYTVRARGGGSLPEHLLTKDELRQAKLECLDIVVASTNIDVEQGWYGCIIDEYVLDVILEGLPERVGGIRNKCPAIMQQRDLIETYLKRGRPLGAPRSVET